MLWISTEEQRRLLLWVKANMRKLKSIIEDGGSSGTDLTDYYTKTQVDTLLSAKANASSVYTKQEIDSMVGNIETLLSEI